LSYSGISIQWPGIADLGMAAAMNTEIRMNRELMLEISYVKMVLRKMLHSCEDVYIEPIQAPLVREILNEDIILPRLRDFTSSVIIARDESSSKPVFQPNDIHRLENVRWTKKEIESKVEEAVRDVLSDSDIDLNHSTNLMDAGLDSLSVVELSQSLRSDFRIELSATVVFSAPSIEDLSNHIENILSIGEVEKNNNDIHRLENVRPRPRRLNAGAGVDRLQIDFTSQSYSTAREFLVDA